MKCKHCGVLSKQHRPDCIVTVARRELRKIEALEKVVINLGRIVEILEEKLESERDKMSV